MKSLVTVALLTILLTSFTKDKDIFIGKIVFKSSYQDLSGKDITNQVGPLFDKAQHYYIDAHNYKAYDEYNNWNYLYNGKTNIYYLFEDGETDVTAIDASDGFQKVILTPLDKTEVIAGYACQSIQMETEIGTTIYYYNPTIKTNPESFSAHNFGGWYKYLTATNGALPLKFVFTMPEGGFIWTTVATEVTRQKLTADDFKIPSSFVVIKE